jgi:hypothetical protein
MRLQRNQHCFRTCHTSRTCKAIRKRYRGGWWRFGGCGFLFGGDFVRILASVSMRPPMMQCGDKHTELSACCTGSVSMGFMHATPGDIKSLRSSAERMALMVSGVWRGYIELGYCEPWKATKRSIERQCNRTPEYAERQMRSKRRAQANIKSLTTGRCAEKDPEIFHSHECAA